MALDLRVGADLLEYDKLLLPPSVDSFDAPLVEARDESFFREVRLKTSKY